jgi:hypothetical protein
MPITDGGGPAFTAGAAVAAAGAGGGAASFLQPVATANQRHETIANDRIVIIHPD